MAYQRDAQGRWAGSTGSRREPFRGIFAGMAKRARKDPVREEASATITSMKQADPKKYWSVSHLGEGYRALRVAGKTSRGGQQAGYVAVRDNKDSVDVGGLVALPGSKGVAKAAFAKVDASYPEHPQTLDAFDEKARSGNINLPALYGKHGFAETGRVPFDPQYAPKEWDESVHGRPDVVMMARPAAQGSLFPQEYPTRPTPEAPKAQPRLHPEQFRRQVKLPGT